MRGTLIYGCIFLLSCGTKPEETETKVAVQTTDSVPLAPAVQVTAADTDTSFAKAVQTEESPVAPSLKSPSGIYRFMLPYEDGKILHTIAFYPGTFRLQEEYPGRKDSTVITEGTWAPSEGFIWIYKDQIARGRYKWNGDTLQYYSPRLKRLFSMQELTPVTVNKSWQQNKATGNLLHGVGNEPFWSIDVTKTDSLVLNMPDWNAPLRVKINEVNAAKDSTVFAAATDSLKLTVYPAFCSDGMSDFLYTQKLKLVYKGQTYKGCGELLRPVH